MDSKNIKRLRNYNVYLAKGIKFYNLKNERLATYLFLIILIIGFISSLIPVATFGTSADEVELNYDNIIVLFTVLSHKAIITYLASVIINIFTSVYLIAVIKDMKGESYSGLSIIKTVLKNIHKIILAHIIFYLFISAGVLIIIIPGIIIYLVYFFNNCYIIDKGKSIASSFKSSSLITKGRKVELFFILVAFYFSSFLFMVLFYAIFASLNNDLVLIFVSAFIGAIINLVRTRLIALTYVDLEYGFKDETEEVS